MTDVPDPFLCYFRGVAYLIISTIFVPNCIARFTRMELLSKPNEYVTRRMITCGQGKVGKEAGLELGISQIVKTNGGSRADARERVIKNNKGVMYHLINH